MFGLLGRGTMDSQHGKCCAGTHRSKREAALCSVAQGKVTAGKNGAGRGEVAMLRAPCRSQSHAASGALRRQQELPAWPHAAAMEQAQGRLVPL